MTTPTRPTDGNIAKHAWDELNRAGMFDADSDYGGMLGGAVMELVTVFAGQNHSGASAWLAADLFRRLIALEPLSDLTDDPTEWHEVADGLWQSRRDSAAFSHDGGKTYHNVDDPQNMHPSSPHRKDTP